MPEKVSSVFKCGRISMEYCFMGSYQWWFIIGSVGVLTMNRCQTNTVKPLISGSPNPKTQMLLVSSRLAVVHWSQVLSREWRCSWSSAESWCPSYIWEINNFIVPSSAFYFRCLTVYQSLLISPYKYAIQCLDIFDKQMKIWGLRVSYNSHRSVYNIRHETEAIINHCV